MKSGDIMGKSRKKDTFIFVTLFCITCVIIIYASYLFYTSFNDGDVISINYNEEQNLNYKVWLKENDFYAEPFVGEDYNVVASSINEIEIDFDYLLNTSNMVMGRSYYTINSRIVAYQKNDNEERKIWDYEKLIKDKVIVDYDKETTTISSKDNFKINYQEYKDLMTNYQNNYAVSLVGNLIIDIELKTDLDYKKFKDKIDLAPRKMTLTVPLTEPIIKISKKVDSASNQELIEKGKSSINYLKLGLSLFSFIGGVIMCFFLGTILVKLLGYDSKYIRDLKRILRTYNAIIVDVDKINMNDKNVMLVKSFDELLDAQSELRAPILHCNYKNNKETLFSIKYDKDILVYRLRSDLYENDRTK